MLKFAASLALSATLLVVPVSSATAGQTISNNLNKCRPGNGPAVLVNLHGIKEASGNIRVQSYRGTREEWLKKGAWLTRIEVPAQRGRMMFCMPVPKSGTYAIAVRHDVNGNGKTDLSTDGGGMSNDPSINIFNMGKPSYKKTAFSVGEEVKSISIQMKYM